MSTQPKLTPAGWQDPPLLQTTRGLMAPAALVRTVGGREDDEEACTWVQYRLGDEIVHESRALKLKKWPPGMDGFTPDFT
jgi:hypothetical protein